jgi:hypothetical protein
MSRVRLTKRGREVRELGSRFGFVFGGRTANGHLLLLHEGSGYKVFTPSTTSDGRRGLRQLEGDLRRALRVISEKASGGLAG